MVSDKFKYLNILCLLALIAWDAPKKIKPINWMTPQGMEVKQLSREKPVLVKIYTDWCVYCKQMDATTWVNDSLENYVNSHFYAIKIDAEHQDSYIWQGEIFEYKPRFKVNMLAVKLLQGNMVYPSLVIIPTHGEPIILPGAYTAKSLEKILKYYGDDYNEKLSEEAWDKIFVENWK